MGPEDHDYPDAVLENDYPDGYEIGWDDIEPTDDVEIEWEEE